MLSACSKQVLLHAHGGSHAEHTSIGPYQKQSLESLTRHRSRTAGIGYRLALTSMPAQASGIRLGGAGPVQHSRECCGLGLAAGCGCGGRWVAVLLSVLSGVG